ncbi:hypothetical protein [Streptomyces sp. NPDC001153]
MTSSVSRPTAWNPTDVMCAPGDSQGRRITGSRERVVAAAMS